LPGFDSTEHCGNDRTTALIDVVRGYAAPVDRAGVMFMLHTLGTLFVILSLAAAVGLCLVPLWHARASVGWTETVCEIQRSEVQASSDDEHAIIKYTYEVGNIRYTSDRLDFAIRGWLHGHPESVLAAVDEYTAGATTHCWYDPADPDTAVLSRSAPATAPLLFPLVFGAAGFLFLQRAARRSRDDALGVHDGLGRCIYTRRGSTPGAVTAIAAIWLVTMIAAITAATFTDAIGRVGIPVCAAIATVALLHAIEREGISPVWVGSQEQDHMLLCGRAGRRRLG
jgi:hypothetical protein